MVTYQVLLEDSSGNTRDFVQGSTESVNMLDIAREHTALSDFEARATIGDYNGFESSWIGPTTEVFITVNSDLIFRGFASRLEGDEETAEATLSGPDMFAKLRRNERETIIENEAIDRAIDQFWDNTVFDGASGSHNVVSPSVNNLLSDENAIFLSAASEWEGATSLPNDDIPFEVLSSGIPEELAVQQTSFTTEAEAFDNKSDGQFGNAPGVVSESDFSDGAGMEIDEKEQTLSYFITPQYNLEFFDFAYRNRFVDNGGSGAPTVEVQIDGGTYNSQTISELVAAQQGIGWHASSDDPNNNLADISLSAGVQYEIGFAVISGSNDTYQIDVVQPADPEFSYNYDNNNGGSSGYLDGPGLYPFQGAEIELKQWPNTSLSGYVNATKDNIYEIELDSSSWNSTDSPQQVAFSNDGGNTYKTLNQTTSGTTTHNGTNPTFGATITTRLQMGGFGSRTTATPQKNYLAQKVDSIDVDFSTNDRAFVGGGRFTGSDFDILQELHEKGGYRWSGQYDRSDYIVESFPRGTSISASYTVKNRTRVKDTEGYANRVVVEGKIRDFDNPDPPREAVEDSSEISAKGETITRFIKDQRVKTQAGAKIRAKEELAQLLKEEEVRGTFTIVPSNVRPGYQYTVTWGDGTTSDLDLETTTYTERHGDAEGRLDFQTIPRLDEKTRQTAQRFSRTNRNI